uniref:Ceramide-1-phosphate transfer protein n=1 Tax=Rattus norvegicus TaxID=10116 RepID=A0A8I6GF85_RAT
HFFLEYLNNLKIMLIFLSPPTGGWASDHHSPTTGTHLRFLNSLGAAFSFISKEVVSKLQIMEHPRSSPQSEHCSSLQSMAAYEVSNKLLDLARRSGPLHSNSGCRTVLCLHRALHWLQLFLEGLRTSSEDARTSTLCTEAYSAMLCAYHSWIRQAVTVAFCALPSGKVFLEMLGEALPFMEQMCDISQFYVEHFLLDLP